MPRKFIDPPNDDCRIPKTFKYTRKACELMDALGELWGCLNTAVVERAVRDAAEREGFDIGRPKRPTQGPQ